MTTRSRLRKLVNGLLGAGALVTWACSGIESAEDGDTGGEDDLRVDLLRSVADNALAPSFAAFEERSTALAAATQAYADAVGSGDDDPAAREAAQEAWRSAMQSWQELEQMQLGPAGATGIAVGGADLRDEIYSWPTVNPCRVDQEIVANEFANDDFVATRLANAYGLDALEYLLFTDSLENACTSPQLPINTGEWDALEEAEILRRRAEYAAAISAALVDQARDLAETWAIGGEFHGYLVEPRGTGSPYGSYATAMDELMRSLFYLDGAVKDAKVGTPSGLFECETPTCLDGLESVYAGRSREHVLANLRGFRRVFLGGESTDAGVGFDDLLADAGHDDLGTEMVSNIEAAVALADGLEGSFSEILTDDPDGLDDLHAAIKRITDDLKGDFATVLTLQIPAEGAGDAD